MDRDVFRLLEADHRRLQKLVERLDVDVGADSRRRALAALRQAVRLHSHVYEDVFVPALHAMTAPDRGERRRHLETLEDHLEAELGLWELSRLPPGSGDFAAKKDLLRTFVERHAHRESQGIVEPARRRLDAVQRFELGELLERRRSRFIQRARRKSD
jgi:hypothetical protein